MIEPVVPLKNDDQNYDEILEWTEEEEEAFMSIIDKKEIDASPDNNS